MSPSLKAFLVFLAIAVIVLIYAAYTDKDN